MNRRNLLRTTALLPISLLPGCGLYTAVTGGATPTSAQVQQAESDVQLIDQALVALESLAGKILGTTSPTLARYANYLNQAAAVATALITAGGSATAGQVQSWEVYVNAGVGALSAALSALNSTDPVIATISTALAAAAALLPTIEAAFNIFAPSPPAAMAADHRAGMRLRASAAMSPEQARRVLAGVLAG